MIAAGHEVLSAVQEVDIKSQCQLVSDMLPESQPPCNSLAVILVVNIPGSGVNWVPVEQNVLQTAERTARGKGIAAL